MYGIYGANDTYGSVFTDSFVNYQYIFYFLTYNEFQFLFDNSVSRGVHENCVLQAIHANRQYRSQTVSLKLHVEVATCTY